MAIIYTVTLAVGNYSDETILVIRIMALGIPADSIAGLCQSAFVAHEKIRFTSLVSLCSGLLKLIPGIMILLVAGSRIYPLAIVYTIAAYLVAGIYLYLVGRHLPQVHARIDWQFCLSQVKAAFPFFILSIFLVVDNRIDVIILSLFYKEDMVGYYAAMNTLLGALFLFPEGLRNAVFPFLARNLAESQEKVRENLQVILKYLLAIVIPLTIVVYYFAADLVVLLFNSTFSPTIDLVHIAIWAFISYAIINILSRLLIVYNLEKSVVLTLILSSVITIVANLILIPLIGVNAAAYIKLLTSFLVLILFLVTVNRKIFKLNLLRSYGNIFLAGLGMVSVFLLLPGISLWLRLLMGCPVYFGILLIMKGFSKKDIALWQDIIASMVPVKGNLHE
jgi:O-antigen/teichoic acid export membrane protein